MSSALTPAAIFFTFRQRLPWVEGYMPAGFPSPATDFSGKRQDLDELLITHLAATFVWLARRLSMIGLGIADADILVVNRALTPKHIDIVVAEVDSDFTVKQFYSRGYVAVAGKKPGMPALFVSGWPNHDDLRCGYSQHQALQLSPCLR